MTLSLVLLAEDVKEPLPGPWYLLGAYWDGKWCLRIISAKGEVRKISADMAKNAKELLNLPE